MLPGISIHVRLRVSLPWMFTQSCQHPHRELIDIFGLILPLMQGREFSRAIQGSRSVSTQVGHVSTMKLSCSPLKNVVLSLSHDIISNCCRNDKDGNRLRGWCIRILVLLGCSARRLTRHQRLPPVLNGT